MKVRECVEKRDKEWEDEKVAREAQMVKAFKEEKR